MRSWISRHVRSMAMAAALSAAVLSSADAAGPAPCFDVRVEYQGREPVKIIDNVQYYRWSYRVYGQGCINRGLSHWVLALCTSTQQTLTGVSGASIDDSDPSADGTTHYNFSVGPDPTTGVSGLKWNSAGGNQVNKNGEYDEFSFVASGNETTIGWAAKGGAIVTSGTTIGPGCAPVPTEARSWGALKALFR